MGKTGVTPIYLEPVYKKSIWAGTRLKKIRNLEEDGIGICREVCAYNGSENRVANGERKGRSIREVIEQEHTWLMGDDESNQLVRVAYMDTAQDLSIQVHPGQEQAEAAGDFEKSESWYILDAEPGACITAGVGLQSKEKIKEAAIQNELEQYLIRIPVQKGDFAMIPAGLVHACGKDMLALEVGSFGGITYRLYDYGRGRELDLEKGMEVLDPSLSCSVRHCQEKKYNLVRHIGMHQLFSVDLVDVEGQWELSDDSRRYHILTCVEGECQVWVEGAGYLLQYTGTIVIPAACRKILVKGRARLLISYRPLAAGGKA